MKKTYNINLAGCGFVIDEDAYDILNSYLTTLAQICERANERETATDIEQRMAEIFAERLVEEHQQIISRRDVEEVIERMGRPEEILEVEVESVSPAQGGQQVPPPFAAMPIDRKLYRDLNNRILGGVCSGIGWYVGIDPVWIRIIAVALAFLSASTLIWIYIILWIIIPAAKTPYQRMQMMGVDPSMQNVGRVVTGEYNPYTPGAQPNPYSPDMGYAPSPSGGPGRVILMIFAVLGLLVVGSVLLAFAAAFIGCLIAVCVSPVAPINANMHEARLIMGCVMSGALVLGIPLFMLFRNLIGTVTGRTMSKFTPQQNLTLLILWILGVAGAVTCGVLI